MNFFPGSKRGRFTLGSVLAVAVGTAIPAMTSLVHDRVVDSGFYDQVTRNTKPRILTVKTDGVTRQGVLSRGIVMPNMLLNFNQLTTKALISGANPQSACWYANLKVVAGQDNLPIREKFFGGSVYSRIFANSAYDNRLAYSCVPVADPSIVTPETYQGPTQNL